LGVKYRTLHSTQRTKQLFFFVAEIQEQEMLSCCTDACKNASSTTMFGE
jgi:hypothetical protein